MARFADTLPTWPALTKEFVLPGPAHEACRRYLAGEDVELTRLRELLPALA